MDKFIYVEPLIEELEIAVEQGFAASGDGDTEDPEYGGEL